MWTNRECKIVEKGISQYEQLKKFVDAILENIDDFKTILAIIENYKDVEIVEACEKDKYIDLLYKDINCSIYCWEDKWKIGAYKIYDRDIGEYLLEDFCDSGTYNREIVKAKRNTSFYITLLTDILNRMKTDGYFYTHTDKLEAVIKDLSE